MSQNVSDEWYRCFQKRHPTGLCSVYPRHRTRHYRRYVPNIDCLISLSEGKRLSAHGRHCDSAALTPLGSAGIAHVFGLDELRIQQSRPRHVYMVFRAPEGHKVFRCQSVIYASARFPRPGPDIQGGPCKLRCMHDLHAALMSAGPRTRIYTCTQVWSPFKLGVQEFGPCVTLLRSPI